MKKITSFLSPRLVGKRFDDHVIPLELLKDFSVLEEMIVEVAKWYYLDKNPNRQRSPRGFTNGISLVLSEINPGSAVPELSITYETDQLFPPDNIQYFVEAKNCIIGAINAAESGDKITSFLPDNLLPFFDKIGRSLQQNESIEFDPNAPVKKAALTKDTRKKLILASTKTKELTDEIDVRGYIPEADQKDLTFEIQIINGPLVRAPIENQHMDTVIKAFNGYKEGMLVNLKGIGRYNRLEKLNCIDSVEHLSILDANDVIARLEELKALKNGWLDGKGIKPSIEGLDWLADRFEKNYLEDLMLPYVYPTAEGGVQLEWTIENWEISLEIELESKHSEWHAFDLIADEEAVNCLNLAKDENWTWINNELKDLGGMNQ